MGTFFDRGVITSNYLEFQCNDFTVVVAKIDARIVGVRKPFQNGKRLSPCALNFIIYFALRSFKMLARIHDYTRKIHKKR